MITFSDNSIYSHILSNANMPSPSWVFHNNRKLHLYGSLSGLVEEALVSNKSYMERNANTCVKLWSKLFFKKQALDRNVGLRLMDG